MATAKAVSAQLIFIANGKAYMWIIQIPCRGRRSTGRSRHFLKSTIRGLRETSLRVGKRRSGHSWARHELKSCGKTRESRFLTAKAVRNDKIWGLATRVTRALFVRFQARVFRSLKGVPLN